jgi:hypothetical protein
VHFGGEDVTRCIQDLLRERILKLIVEPMNGQELPEIVVAASGDQATMNAHLNSEALRAAAEFVKIELCSTEHGTSVKHPKLVARLHVLVNRLYGKFPDSPGSSDRLLVSNPAIQESLESAVEAGELTVSLEEVYDHRPRDTDTGLPSRSIRERLAECIEELCSFAEQRGETINVVVMAGASSRLPLVEKMIRDRLRNVLVSFDRERPKSKVAAGLARYLTLRDDRPQQVEGICCPTDYTHAPIGRWLLGSFEQIIPAWSSIHDTRWHAPKEGRLQDWWDSKSKSIKLNLRSRVKGARDKYPLWGTFDLSRPGIPPPDDSPVLPDLPAAMDAQNCIEIRFADGMENVELRVVAPSGIYGYWPLIRHTKE